MFIAIDWRRLALAIVAGGSLAVAALASTIGIGALTPAHAQVSGNPQPPRSQSQRDPRLRGDPQKPRQVPVAKPAAVQPASVPKPPFSLPPAAKPKVDAPHPPSAPVVPLPRQSEPPPQAKPQRPIAPQTPPPPPPK